MAALNATDDETGDGKVDALDLKHQLDRMEAQLELQDQQNRACCAAKSGCCGLYCQLWWCSA